MIRILTGDCRAVMRTLPADSVDCVVTSPPYWGLRDYGVDGQLGLEPTLGEHLAVMVDVFREVRRVMKPCATLWLNYGDCYATSVNGRSAADTKAAGNDDRTFRDKPFSTVQGTLKPKDLCMVPHRLAIALQDDGWWVRQDIVWSKPNPMPESIKDRCTKSHEYIFLLTKSARYYFDAEAIAEDAEYTGLAGQDASGFKDAKLFNGKHGQRAARGKALTSPRNDGNTWNENNGRGFVPTSDKRNKRSVWTVPTSPFPEAHFATFPPALVEPCILAGCPKDGTVLDPFGGAGTVGLVADRLQRNAILVELNPTYADMARKRLTGDAPLFADVQAVA